jgi:hypothetical protein
MNRADDPFLPLVDDAVTPGAGDDFAALSQRPAAPTSAVAAGAAPDQRRAPTLARLEGFDVLDQPRIGGVAGLAGEVVVARSTVALRRSEIGRDVFVMFANDDLRQPVILGVIEPRPLVDDPLAPPGAQADVRVETRVDGERRVIEAEREVVLRCGDASITLTRGGKVVIKGHYILSRSSGYNKIKGAAIDIN